MLSSVAQEKSPAGAGPRLGFGVSEAGPMGAYPFIYLGFAFVGLGQSLCGLSGGVGVGGEGVVEVLFHQFL